jgi:hypothetical protein
MHVHVHARVLAKAIALAVLADAQAPQRRTVEALRARVQVCLGHAPGEEQRPLPAPLQEQLRRLATLPTREWARLGAEDIGTWLREGFWRRMAGVRTGAPSARGARVPDDGFDEEDNDTDDDGMPAAPPSQWTARALAEAFRQWASHVTPKRWLLRSATTGPLPAWRDSDGARAGPLLATAADLAGALAVSLEDLLWLAPEHAHWRERQPGGGHAMAPSHYRYRLLPKPSGGLRLLEAPRPRLAQAQRRILDLLLAPIPVHEAAHGFVCGCGVGSHAQVHAGQAVVIRFDLADFFTHIHATRVRALWQALGHGRAASDLLTRLTTARTPAAVRERLRDACTPLGHPSSEHWHATGRHLASAHLPQGAPTSPALANLCAFGLDLRLEALARRFGARYTRYADDLVFSGPQTLLHAFVRLRAWVSAIAQDEGFALRASKTRVMPAHQRQYVTGLVVNHRVNWSRAQFDTLKARLHRLARQACVDPGERARLAGEIQWARQWLAPTRSAKLQRLFEAIRFADSGTRDG